MNRPLLIAIATCLLVTPVAHSQLVFDNSNLTNPPGGTSGPVDGIVGEVVQLIPGNYAATRLEFEIARGGHPGIADFELFLYQVSPVSLSTGVPLSSPFWSSGVIEDRPYTGESETVVFDIPNVPVPNVFMWATRISGIPPSEPFITRVLSAPGTPSLGAVGNRFIQYAGDTTFTLFPPAASGGYTLRARIYATQIPEPATLALLIAGVVTVASLSRCRQTL